MQDKYRSAVLSNSCLCLKFKPICMLVFVRTSKFLPVAKKTSFCSNLSRFLHCRSLWCIKEVTNTSNDVSGDHDLQPLSAFNNGFNSTFCSAEYSHRSLLNRSAPAALWHVMSCSHWRSLFSHIAFFQE